LLNLDSDYSDPSSHSPLFPRWICTPRPQA